MISAEWIGYCAATLTTISFVPQVWQIWKTKHTKDISLRMYLLFTCGVKAGCACKNKSAPPSTPADVLRAAGLELADGAVIHLGALTIYRPPSAEVRARALEALCRTNFTARIWNDQIVIRDRVHWSGA